MNMHAAVPENINTTGPVDVSRAQQDAYTTALHARQGDMVKYLIDKIGQRRTAAALGLQDARPLRGWADGGAIKGYEVSKKLRVLYRITYAIENAFDADVAAAFLESTSPYLEDRSPIAVLATESIVDAESQLVAAQKAFLEV